MLSRRLAEDRGFTAAELLVVILLLGIVGSVALNGLVGSFRATQRSQDRIDGYNELQIVMEGMTRDIRAADPLAETTPTNLTGVARRAGGCERFSFDLVGTSLQHRRESSATCGAFGSSVAMPVVDDVANGAVPVFRYMRVDGTVTTVPTEASRVEIRLIKQLPDASNVEIRTMVAIRNA